MKKFYLYLYVLLLSLPLSCKLIMNPYIEILDPNGGEVYREGDTISVTWESGGDVSEDIDLKFLKNENNILDSDYGEKNNGKFTWIIPDVTQTYDSCKIEITTQGPNGEIKDESDGYFTIIADSTYYKITNPNSNQSYNEGDTIQISWESGGDVSDYVKLYFKINNSNYQQIASFLNNYGEYLWIIPDVEQTYDSCKIKITDYYSDAEDESDGYFTIIADSTYYKITNPNGNETWAELTTQTITWESSGNIDDQSNIIELSYSLDSGLDWISIDEYESNDGTFSWTIPEVYVTNSSCRIKINNRSNPSIEDISDADFTITGGGGSSIVNVLSANGNEVWHEQTTEDITWYTTGDIGGNEVYIGYSTDGGNYWNDAVDDGGSNSGETTANPPHTYYWDITSNDGSYSWTLPNFSDTLNSCIIGIWSAADTELYDMSDGYFTITCDSNFYRILHPNGGETFQKETDRYILWESGGDVGVVEIYYSLFGGESWYLIDDYEYNDSLFLWSVPSIQGTNDACKIKIQSRDREDWFDISDFNFTIADTAIFEIDMSFETGENFSDWTFGDAWTVDIGEAYDGNKSAVCENEDGTLSKTITVNSGVISFFYKTKFYSSSSYYDNFTFKIDGEEIFEIGEPFGESDWTLFEYYVPAGTYNFEWIHNNYYSYNAYTRIDAISFP